MPVASRTAVVASAAVAPRSGRRAAASVFARGRSRPAAAAAALALAILTGSPGAAQAPALDRVGAVTLPGPAGALAAGDGLLVAAIGASVHVIAITAPDAPVIAGRYDFDQPVLGLAAVGRAAFAANSHDGLRRLDLADPAAPALTGTAPTRGQAVGVAAADGHLFVGDNSLGFDVVADGTDGADAADGFARVGEYLGDGFPRGIAAAAPLVFVADQPAGLIVVDAAAPDAPASVGQLSLGRDPVTAVIAPDARSLDGAPPAVVCLVSGRAGLQAVDVSDPAAPAVTARIATADRPAGAALWDRRLYAASGDRLQVFDLTDPARPALVGSADLGGPAGPVAVTDALVLAAAGDAVVVFRR